METAPSIGSLKPNERNHLPDPTKVTLPRRGTVTLGTLREEHRARLERFSRAALWGKRVAERMPKPTTTLSQNASSAKNFSIDRNTGQVTIGDGTQGRKPPAGQQQVGATGNSAAHAAQPPAKPNPNVVASGPSSRLNNNAAKTATSAVLSSFIPLPTYSGPIPADYLAFCNAALSSACVYLPPNTTFTTDYSGNPNDQNRYVIDVDPLITDAGTCSSMGGKLDAQQQCEFRYFFAQQTTFKPGLTPVAAAACDQPSYYVISSKGGWIEVAYPPPAGYLMTTTGATPVTCVVQAWMNQ